MNDSGVETVMDPVVPLGALLEMGEPVSWSRRRKENGTSKGSLETIEGDLKTDNEYRDKEKKDENETIQGSKT